MFATYPKKNTEIENYFLSWFAGKFWSKESLLCYINFRGTIVREWTEKFIGWLWCNGQIWLKCGLFFNIPLWSTQFFHHCCSAWIPILDSSHPDPQKHPQLHMTSSLVWYWFPAKCFFFMLVNRNRWCQLRRIWRVINQFKATVMHSSHCNHRLVGRSIVLVKQDSFCQFSRPFGNVSSTTFQSPELSSVGLSGRKHCS